MHTHTTRCAVGTAEQPTKPDLFELANALAVDAAELRVYLLDEETLSPTRLLCWARVDASRHLDTVEQFLDHHRAHPEVTR